MLGVCLGHQAIGQAFGGRVVRADKVMHGKTDTIHTTRVGVFQDLPAQFEVARYHSLVVELGTLPDCLEVTATSSDGQIMGLRHRTHPIEGVQFHPESVASEHGHALLRNFLRA
jgi:anthranilate synthase component 2